MTYLISCCMTACQKKINSSIVEIIASPTGNNIHNRSLPTTRPQNDINSSVIHDKNDSQSSCVNSLSNTQCDCKCGLLAAELEGIKLQGRIQRVSSVSADTVRFFRYCIWLCHCIYLQRLTSVLYSIKHS